MEEEGNRINEKMIVVALRCFIFFGIIVAYSAGVWNLINGYFGKEFHAYMAKHPERPIPPRLLQSGNESSGATEIDAVAISALLESVSRDYSREEEGEHEKLCNMMDQVHRPRTEEEGDGDDDTAAADNSVYIADDADLIISSALNHNPIDETWWSNYWGEKDSLPENRSAGQNDEDQDGNNGFCRPLKPEDEESCSK